MAIGHGLLDVLNLRGLGVDGDNLCTVDEDVCNFADGVVYHVAEALLVNADGSKILVGLNHGDELVKGVGVLGELGHLYHEGGKYLFLKNDINNTKIRDGKMDIKTYVQTVDGFEQWNPLMKGEFPIAKEVLEKEVFPAFMVEMPKLTKDTYTYEEFIGMVKACPDLAAVRVHKQRFGYMVTTLAPLMRTLATSQMVLFTM